jgi:hypothetical protein
MPGYLQGQWKSCCSAEDTGLEGRDHFPGLAFSIREKSQLSEEQAHSFFLHLSFERLKTYLSHHGQSKRKMSSFALIPAFWCCLDHDIWCYSPSALHVFFFS